MMFVVVVVFFFKSAGGEIVILETRPLESSWLSSLGLEKYCYNTLKWHTLIDHRGTERKKKHNRRKEKETRQRREADKRSSKKLHTVGRTGKLLRDFGLYLWKQTNKNKNKTPKKHHGSTFIQKRNDTLERMTVRNDGGERGPVGSDGALRTLTS